MIRFSNNSVFEQLSRTNCVRKPRFDCITKKTCCIKIVPTDCFACEAHQETQQLKKAILFTLKEIK